MGRFFCALFLHLFRCLYFTGVYILQVYISYRCIYLTGVYILQVSTYKSNRINNQTNPEKKPNKAKIVHPPP